MATNVIIVQKTASGNTIMHPFSKAANISIATNNSSIPANVDDVEDLVANLGDLAFEDNINIPSSDAINSNTSDTLATSKAVYTLNQAVVHNTTNENVAGVKTFTDGINIGDCVLRYDSTTDTLNISKAVAQQPQS